MRRLFSLLVSVLSLAFIVSCSTHTSDNGDLDGFWQMTAVEALDGCNTTDMYALPMYWSFEVNLMEVKYKDEPWGVFFRFNHTKDSLIISEPIRNNRDSGDIKIITPELIRPYGVYHLREGFAVEHLSSSTMILKSDSIRARFRKY